MKLHRNFKNFSFNDVGAKWLLLISAVLILSFVSASPTIAKYVLSENPANFVFTSASFRIPTVQLSAIPVPVTGAIAQTVITTPSSDYTIVGGIQWEPALNNGKFKPGTSYTASVNLKANGNKTFYSAFNLMVNGILTTNFSYEIISGGALGNTAVVIITFPPTEYITINITGVQIPQYDDTVFYPTAVNANVNNDTQNPQRYTASLKWDNPDFRSIWWGLFYDAYKKNTVYTAVITVTAKNGFNFDGVEFKILNAPAGTTINYTSKNGPNTLGEIRVVFPKT